MPSFFLVVCALTLLLFAAPAEAASGCAPIEIGAGKWVTPLCEPTPPAVALRSVRRFNAKPLPFAVDLRDRGVVGPVRDQQQVGVCWAFALSAAIDSSLRSGDKSIDVSSLHIVSKRLYGRLYKTNAAFPVLTSESSWPYQAKKACKLQNNDEFCGRPYGVEPGSWASDSVLVSELNAADGSGAIRITDVEHLPAEPEEVASVLANGEAVYAVLGFHYDGWNSRAVRDGVINDYVATQYEHAVVLVGYRATPVGRQFLMQNSWGTDWAQGGFAWISEAMVRRHLSHAMRIRAEGPRGASPPPVATGCGAGQARDLVTGQCSARCANGLAPAAGLCLAVATFPSLPVPSWPAPTASTTCSQGEVRDLLSGACTRACGNGLPPTAGLCWQ